MALDGEAEVFGNHRFAVKKEMGRVPTSKAQSTETVPCPQRPISVLPIGYGCQLRECITTLPLLLPIASDFSQCWRFAIRPD